MTDAKTDTICALSTPRGRGALALIRVSGPRSLEIAQSLSGLEFQPRLSRLSILRGRDGKPLDEAVLTFFKSPNSFTGEDMLEISCHGNPAIVERILADLVSRETRPAEPGEFSRRALANDKLGLSEVEALDWILNSKSFAAAELGLQSKMGALDSSTAELRESLLNLNVALESQLDFSEGETGLSEPKEIAVVLKSVKNKLIHWLKSYETNKKLLQSWTVVLAGPPNSGKSSLFNALIGGNKAIVFDQPGTTRDFLEHHFEMNGQSVVLVDTAGIRDSQDPIERLGIDKSLQMMKAADLICWVDEAGRMDEGLKERFPQKNWIIVQSKADLVGEKPTAPSLSVSAKTGMGIQELKALLFPGPDFSSMEQVAPLTSDRQKELVRRAVENLEQGEQILLRGGYLDQVSDLVRKATQNLNELSGGLPTNDILKEIFSRFCIGK